MPIASILNSFVILAIACYTQTESSILINWEKLQQNIKVAFRDQSLLQQAFTHSSHTNENPDELSCDNERLEFLGDALLSFIIADNLYQECPDTDEGKLTEIRVSLIREETLAQIASELKLGDYLYLGKGEASTGGRQRQTNLADTLEALIGAIFLDQGLDAARNFILNRFKSHLEKTKLGHLPSNYKSQLQEYTQSEYKQLPTYHLVEETGPDHDKTFTVSVLIEDKILGKGSGKSKKIAEMEAARAAMEKIIEN